jgi:hypothetical protein
MKSLTELNTFSVQSLAYDDQGTGAQTLANRYQINGLLDTAQPVMKNIEKVCNAAGSWLSYDIHEGKWGVVINATGTSVASFNSANIIGSISINGTGLSELYNSVRVEFPHRELKDSADYITISIPDADKNANEAANTLNLSYDIINEPIQAQLLGFIELKQSRIDLVIKFASDFTKISLKAGDIIDVTDDKLTFSSKLFRIISMTEVQDDQGALKVEITALEYDPDVYSIANLYRYTRSDADGIITIGNIGTPTTPTVTKFEIDSRPRVVIATTSPTGVVEGVEFWLTTDVSVPLDENRNYTLIGTTRPVNGNTFPSGTQVQFDYDIISTGNFLVKARGINSTTAGPFSPTNGFNFTPTQQTQSIGPETKILDALGNVLLIGGAQYLLGQLGGLIKGNIGTDTLISSIINSITSATGINLSSGTVPTTPLSVYDEGTVVNNKVTKLNFQGDGVIASQTGDVINVVIGNSGGSTSASNIGLISVTSVTPNHGPQAGGTAVSIIGSGFETYTATSVTFGGAAATNVVRIDDTLISCTTPSHGAGTVSVNVKNPTTGAINLDNGYFTYDTVGYLNPSIKYPASIGGFAIDEVPGNTGGQAAPVRGSYFIKFTGPVFYGGLVAGSGNATLYKSDGTQVQQLAAGNLIFHNDVVEFPFNTREFGTDYYITIDEGTITYCTTWINYKFGKTTWSFNTPAYDVTPYNISGSALATFSPSPPTVNSISPSGTNVSFSDNLIINWSKTIQKGSGTVNVYKDSDDSLVKSFNVSSGTVSGNRLSFTGLASVLSANTKYYVTISAGSVQSQDGTDCFTISLSSNGVVNKGSNLTFTTISEFQLTDFKVESAPIYSNPSEGGSTDPDYQKVNPQTYIQLIFNRTPVISAGTITIYKADSSIHQEFKYPAANDYVGNIAWIPGSNSVRFNPTKDLTPGATYYINATSGSIRDSYNAPWQGITNSSDIRFSIDPGPSATTSPVTDNSSKIIIKSDRSVDPGPGSIQVVDALGNFVGTFSSTDPSVAYQ